MGGMPPLLLVIYKITVRLWKSRGEMDRVVTEALCIPNQSAA